MESFLKANYQELLLEIVESTDMFHEFNIDIDLMILADQFPDILTHVSRNAEQALKDINTAVRECQKDLIFDNETQVRYSFKEKVSINFFNFPINSSMNIYNIPKSSKKGKLVVFIANVLRVTDKKVLIQQRSLKCAKCGHNFFLKSLEDQYNVYIKPKMCPAEACKSNKFNEVEHESMHQNATDYQVRFICYEKYK